ncbi:hypothetical protein TrLO_g3161, partial [Triparma laevis f. longispina]
KIAKVNSDGSVNVDFDDGDKDRFVDMKSVKLEGGGGGSDSEDDRGHGRGGGDSDAPIDEGVKVEARYRGKAKYYSGKITRVRSNGTYDVAYDDGEKEFGVKREMIKVLESSRSSRSRGRDDESGSDEIGEGDKVEARYRGKSKWYSGKVARVRSNGTMDIHYDDGEKELGVDPSFVRAVKKSSSRSPRGRRDDSET